MSVEPGLRHGKYSKDRCIRFLSKHYLKEKDFKDLLEAIENHDIKEYTSLGNQTDLITILSVADDLDAFGFTGIFRYSEIYLTREIALDKIGYFIKENAGRRFENLFKIYGSFDEFVKKHEKRYTMLDDFFTRYNNQVPGYQFGNQNPFGYCGIIKIFNEMIRKKITLKDLYNGPFKESPDPVIKWYIEGLISELVIS